MARDVEVVVWRGDIAESRHRVAWVLVDPTGCAIDGVSGDAVTTFRSAAKPFQLLPLVERGHADALGLTDEHLAIMAASHTGSAAHRDLVSAMLSRFGLEPGQLACGYHDPSDPAALAEVRLHPERQSRLYNNCSGKHAGMLALAQREGWPLAGYHLPEHPLQQLMRRTVAEACGCTPESLGVAIDGCSVSVFALPLAAMARGYAQLGAAMQSADDPRARTLQRIGRAMTAHPRMVEGDGRLSTELMLATKGRLVAKGGAEGLQLVADTQRGLGLALKCEDGSARAVAPATMAVLGALGWLTTPEQAALEAQRRSIVTDATGQVVGHLEATVALAVPVA